MGDSKLEIVLLGDAVNTTARIEQACRELDRTFLASADALALINLPNGVESERMPPAALILAPDWACEVLSCATRRLDLVDKRPVYAREGVPHLWLVDRAGRTLEEFELHDGQWLLIASAKDDDPISIQPFNAITFSLGDLWP